ncbi:MAG: hypothetical protein K5682_11515 [Lachnospiraceae bacterium]|nr:hypothetical protein [Lachnospiraceae bacterium]
MLKTRLLLITLLLSVLLTACSSVSSRTEAVPHKISVLKYVKDTCSEACELISYEQIYNSPDHIIYYFHSMDRELEFQVYRSITEEGGVQYQSDYANVVRDQYADEISALFEDFSYSIRPGILLQNTDELEPLTRAVCAANEIYRKELTYNSQAFLQEHPYGSLTLYGKTGSEKNDYPEKICTFSIDGSVPDATALQAQTSSTILQMLEEGRLSSEFY